MPIDTLAQGSVATTPSTGVQRAQPVTGADGVAARQQLPREGNAVPTQAANTVPGEADVQQAVRNLTDYAAQTLRRDLRFSVDKDSGRTVIKVVDSETGKVIRQIPPDEVLSIAKHLADSSGMLLKAKA
jgi:flagellar protein FlaG